MPRARINLRFLLTVAMIVCGWQPLVNGALAGQSLFVVESSYELDTLRSFLMVDVERPTGTIRGTLIDGGTGETVPGAVIRLSEIERNRVSAADGSFEFENLAPKRYTITTRHIGYAPAQKRVPVREGEIVEVTLEIFPSVLELPGLIVTGTGRERGVREAYRPSAVVSGTELQSRLQSSVAGTIAHLPGISLQYNGPGAAQPVIRGMGGDRVLVLEDNQRTGDLSATAADHAVAVEPLTAEAIEVVRGPAGLLYGSNALGGVINVTRGEVPRGLPARPTGSLTVQGESVNRGMTGGGAITLPFRSLAVRGELSGRLADDVRTPIGPLPSTDMESYNTSIGASWIPFWGFAGVSFRQYEGRYGVPGQFQGQLIPGAHPGGVEAEFLRRAGQLRVGHLIGVGPFSAVELDANVNHYLHDEIEGRAGGAPFYGARFDQLSANANVLARHQHHLHPFRAEGAVGISAHSRDLVSIGTHTGSRSAYEYSLAAFVFEEFGRAPFRLQLGGRYDWGHIRPKNTRPIQLGDQLLPVRERQFGAFSGSASGLLDLNQTSTIGLSIARAFRNPSIEELYSDGPHLADHSFDIGNPDLRSEFGTGVDAFIRISAANINLEVGGFANWISNYIYYRPTGEIDPRFGRFPVFQATADNATFYGLEGRAQIEVVRGWAVDGTVSYVRGTRAEFDDPLPGIPPLDGNFEIRYDARQFFATVGWEGAAAQNRVPRPIRNGFDGQLTVLLEPTPAYSFLNAGFGIRLIQDRWMHTITVQGRNLNNVVWRDHLSRVKDVVPQPGRNVQVAYRIIF